MSRELRNKDELRRLLDSALELTGVKVGQQEEFERRWAAVLACVAVDAPPSERVPELVVPEDTELAEYVEHHWTCLSTHGEAQPCTCYRPHILAALEYCAAQNRRPDARMP